MRRHSRPRCVCCWWHSRWVWLWRSGIAFKLSSRYPILEKSDVWAPPLSEAAVAPGRAWRLLKTLPGLKAVPAARSGDATRVKEELYRLVPSARDPRVRSNVREHLWTMRHMDDYVIVGPLAKVKKLTEDMERIMLLRDVQFLELGKPPVKFLGWMLERSVGWLQVGDQSAAD